MQHFEKCTGKNKNNSLEGAQNQISAQMAANSRKNKLQIIAHRHVHSSRTVYIIDMWRFMHGMEDATEADLATPWGSRSWSTLVRRSHIRRLSINNCGAGMVANALTKHCLTESGESRDPENCAPLSVPKR